MRICVWAGLGGLLFACTKSNDAARCADGVCIDSRFPYCDIAGAVSGTENACIAVSCSPDEIGLCDGKTAYVCDVSGTSYSTVECAEMCSPENGCFSFSPSNGLGSLAGRALIADALVIPSGAVINTDTGIVQVGATELAAASVEVLQADDTHLRVFLGSTIELASLHITGTSPVAFVAASTVTINGTVTLAASYAVPGPGAITAGDCAGRYGQTFDASGCTISIGGGGAGHATPGGSGGARSGDYGAPGMARNSLTPLRGGCRGGDTLDATLSTVVHQGGGGGGALQLVAGDSITLNAGSVVHAGGGGGADTAGGGSGGLVLFESRHVIMETGAGVAANGASGGGCSMNGVDGQSTNSSAIAPYCSYFFAGNGGTYGGGPGQGCDQSQCSAPTCPHNFGGGGGAVGRLVVRTGDNGFENSGYVAAALDESTF